MYSYVIVAAFISFPVWIGLSPSEQDAFVKDLIEQGEISDPPPRDDEEEDLINGDDD